MKIYDIVQFANQSNFSVGDIVRIITIDSMKGMIGEIVDIQEYTICNKKDLLYEINFNFVPPLNHYNFVFAHEIEKYIKI